MYGIGSHLFVSTGVNAKFEAEFVKVSVTVGEVYINHSDTHSPPDVRVTTGEIVDKTNNSMNPSTVICSLCLN